MTAHEGAGVKPSAALEYPIAFSDALSVIIATSTHGVLLIVAHRSELIHDESLTAKSIFQFEPHQPCELSSGPFRWSRGVRPAGVDLADSTDGESDLAEPQTSESRRMQPAWSALVQSSLYS